MEFPTKIHIVGSLEFHIFSRLIEELNILLVKKYLVLKGLGPNYALKLAVMFRP